MHGMWPAGSLPLSCSGHNNALKSISTASFFGSISDRGCYCHEFRWVEALPSAPRRKIIASQLLYLLRSRPVEEKMLLPTTAHTGFSVLVIYFRFVLNPRFHSRKKKSTSPLNIRRCFKAQFSPEFQDPTWPKKRGRKKRGRGSSTALCFVTRESWTSL